LLQASVDGLNIKPDGIYGDVTFGGGHSKEIHKTRSQRKAILIRMNWRCTMITLRENLFYKRFVL
jgi:16S rRNA C1402 N4-methylase RsmH